MPLLLTQEETFWNWWNMRPAAVRACRCCGQQAFCQPELVEMPAQGRKPIRLILLTCTTCQESRFVPAAACGVLADED